MITNTWAVAQMNAYPELNGETNVIHCTVISRF
jgi:hypothetical protein